VEVSVEFNRVAGFGALGFVAVVLGVTIALEAGGPPRGDAPPAEVAAYFAEHTTAVQFGIALAGLAWVLITLFGAGAAVRIGRAERGGGEAWSMAGLVGIAMLTVMFSAVTAVRLALTSGDPATGTLWHLHNAFFTVNNVSLVVVLTAFSVGGLRTAVLRPWHASLGLISAGLIAIGNVVGSFNAGGGPAGLSLAGFAGWLLWLAWLGTFGVVLLRTKASVPAHA
jgi:hypothetical protein